jgi:hypothetical protein
MKKSRFRPRLEALEDRLCPAPFTYTWTDGTGNGLWGFAANWSSSNGGTGFPLASNGDTVKFDASAPRGGDNCRLSAGTVIGAGSFADLNSSNSTNPWLGTLTLEQNVSTVKLTWINGGGGTNTSIALTGGTLTLTGVGTFTRGSIGTSATDKNFIIANGGDLRVNNDVSVTNLGTNLVVQNGGIVELKDQQWRLNVLNNSVITINAGGELDFGDAGISGNTAGLKQPSGNTSYVDVQGKSYCTAINPTIGSMDTIPMLVEGTAGLLEIGQNRTLNVDSGSTNTNNYCVYVNGQGATVQLDCVTNTPQTTLAAITANDDLLDVHQGYLNAKGASVLNNGGSARTLGGFVYIESSGIVEFLHDLGSYVTLTVQDQALKIAGTVVLNEDGGGTNGDKFNTTNSLTLTSLSTLEVVFDNTLVAGKTWKFMTYGGGAATGTWGTYTPDPIRPHTSINNNDPGEIDS